jgi:hypothetical protein
LKIASSNRRYASLLALTVKDHRYERLDQLKMDPALQAHVDGKVKLIAFETLSILKHPGNYGLRD